MNQTQTPSRTPQAEITVDARLVTALLQQQHPDLAALTVQPAESGWDNAMYRLGTDLAVRLPRRELGVRGIVHEQAWLPLLAERLPLPVPAAVRIGVPGCGYPWPWSIVPWLEGTTADLAPAYGTQARPLAEFLRALHVAAPMGAPRNDFRGVPLGERQPLIEQRIERLEGLTGPLDPGLHRIWQNALAAPLHTTSTWVHGDLHARNVLCSAGRISGIIDWGDSVRR